MEVSKSTDVFNYFLRNILLDYCRASEYLPLIIKVTDFMSLFPSENEFFKNFLFWLSNDSLPRPSSNTSRSWYELLNLAYFENFLGSFMSLSFIIYYWSPLREGFNKKTKKNMDISIFGSDPPIHPLNMDKTKKRHVVFWAF